MYEYRAFVENVVDGDTIDVMIDLGFHVHVAQRIRVYGVDAYEKNTIQGAECKTRVKELIEYKFVLVQSIKPGGGDKYGRYLANILIPDIGLLSDWIINNGYGYSYFGDKKPDVSTIANQIKPSGELL